MPFPDSFLQELKLRNDITEIFSEEWGCLRSAPSAGLLRLPHFQ